MRLSRQFFVHCAIEIAGGNTKVQLQIGRIVCCNFNYILEYLPTLIIVEHKATHNLLPRLQQNYLLQFLQRAAHCAVKSRI